MKHRNNRRLAVIALALALVLTLSVLPVSAMDYTEIYQDIFNTREGYLGDDEGMLSSTLLDSLDAPVTGNRVISIDQYDRYVNLDGEVYEFMGMGPWFRPADLPRCNDVESITIPPFPESESIQVFLGFLMLFVYV